MKLKKFIKLLICILWLGLALLTLGAGPPPAYEVEPSGQPPVTPVLELTTAIDLPQSEIETTSEPLITPTVSLTSPIVMAEYKGREVKLLAEAEVAALSRTKAPANTTIVTSENFEGLVPSLWQAYDNNGSQGGIYSWGKEACFSTAGTSPGSRGAYSIWVAGLGGNPSLNPCPGANDLYPGNLDAWVVYGPFSLVEAKTAWFDFHYWLDNGGDPQDKLSWGVSLDVDKDNFNAANFHMVNEISGVYTTGPFANSTAGRHNFVRVDLTQVPGLGNVTGKAKVWIGFRFVSDNGAAGRGAFIDTVSIHKNPGSQRKITVENFERVFPTGYESWLSYDNNGSTGGSYRWGSVNCKTRSGARAMWLAQNNGTAGGLNPCHGMPEYPPVLLDSWLQYGPFSLENVDEAWVEFYFRNNSQPLTNGNPATGDLLYWWASVDNQHYYGPGVSGAVTGSFGAGYNQMQFDLSRVPGLGDLRGQSAVWLAFVFQSNGDANVGEGAFIDDVSLVAVDSYRTYLPLAIKSEPVPVGGITFSNFTKNPIIIELVGLGQRTFPATQGPHVWDNIPAGTYDWQASGTCPSGQGQVGSVPPYNRQKITVIANKLDNRINVENGGKFDCNG